MLSEWRHSDGAGGIFNGNRKANAHEETLVYRVENRSDDADDLAARSYQRAAGAARIHRGVELDEIRQQAFAFRGNKFAAQAGNDAGRRRRADAERKANGDHLVAQGEVRCGAHGGGDKIVGNFMRLKHG